MKYFKDDSKLKMSLIKSSPNLIVFIEKQIWNDSAVLQSSQSAFKPGIDMLKTFYSKKVLLAIALDWNRVWCGSCWKILKWYLLFKEQDAKMSHKFLRAYVIKPPSYITKIHEKQNKSNKNMSINTSEMKNVAKRNPFFSHCWITLTLFDN